MVYRRQKKEPHDPRPPQRPADPAAPAARGVSSRLPGRHGCPRMGPVRLRLRLRRRLRRPPVLRPRHHQPRAGGTHGYKVGIISQPDWRDPRLHHGPGRAAAWLSRYSAATWTPWSTTTPSPSTAAAPTPTPPAASAGKRPDHAVDRLLQPHPPALPACAHPHRRHRGKPAPPCALRLLVRQAQALHPARLQRRPAASTAWASAPSSRWPRRLDGGIPVRQSPSSTAPCTRRTRSSDVYDARGCCPAATSCSPTGDKAYARELRHPVPRTRTPSPRTRLVEPYPHEHDFVVQNPPSAPAFAREELDAVYEPALRTRTYHPDYDAAGGVPGHRRRCEFASSSNRGCFGDCSFCALTFHQGRIVQARSHAVARARRREPLTAGARLQGLHPRRGRPHRQLPAPACTKQLTRGACSNQPLPVRQSPAATWSVDHDDYLTLLRKLRAAARRKEGLRALAASGSTTSWPTTTDDASSTSSSATT